MIIGNFGFMYFDLYRKTYMGIAMMTTFISIWFTIAGCMALSTAVSVVMKSYWVFIEMQNSNTGEYFRVYMGLRSMVYECEPCTVHGCEKWSFLYEEILENKVVFPNKTAAYLEQLEDCYAEAHGAWFGMFTTCATLIFALIGCMNRMRFSSDANIQKFLGMVTDFCGFVSLLVTMSVFGHHCYGEVPRNYGDIVATVELSRGYWFYIVCLVGAFTRALFHWVTPLPGQGSGCSPEVPEYLTSVLDVNGDGTVDINDFCTEDGCCCCTGWAHGVDMKALEEAQTEHQQMIQSVIVKQPSMTWTALSERVSLSERASEAYNFRGSTEMTTNPGQRESSIGKVPVPGLV